MPTVVELKAMAKAKGMKGYSKLCKADLEQLLGMSRSMSKSRLSRRSKSKRTLSRISQRSSSSPKQEDIISHLEGKTVKQQSAIIWEMMGNIKRREDKLKFKKIVETLENKGVIELDFLTSEAISDFA